MMTGKTNRERREFEVKREGTCQDESEIRKKKKENREGVDLHIFITRNRK